MNKIIVGKTMLDTSGKRIQAHGGGIMYIDGTYYWYGENKEFTLPENDIWTWGIRLYSSKDFYNWKDEGLIIPPEENNINDSLHYTKCVDRPHILYNKMTKKYVCWIKVMDKEHGQTMTILVSDNIKGPYTKVKEYYRPVGMNSGDFDLVIEQDNKAYIYFERPHFEMICADLSDDYLSTTGYYSTHFPSIRTPFSREAPAHFVRRGIHYLMTSGTTGYKPNPTEVASSRCIHGPYNVLGRAHLNDVTNTSFNSQISCIIKIPNKKDLYVALADRWIPNIKDVYKEKYEDGSFFDELIKEANMIINGEETEELKNKLSISYSNKSKPLKQQMNENTSIADYVFLPIKFKDDGTPYIEYVKEWSLDDFE